MTSLFTKRKMFIIATCIFLVTMSTVFFLIGEDKLNIETHDLHTFILHENDLEEDQNESFYRNLINNHEDDLFILNTDTTIRFSTTKWQEKLGYEESDIHGKNFFTFIHPKDLPFVANSMIELVKNAEIKENIGPFRLMEKEGQYRLYIGKGIPLENEKEEITAIALTLRDISEPLGAESESSLLISAVTK